jgi:hypothetical protein
MRNLIIWAAALLVGLTFAHPSSAFGAAAVPAYPAAAAGQGQETITVPAGTSILVRTVDSINSSQQQAGFRFKATLETNLMAGGRVVAPRGTTVFGRLAEAKSAGRFKGQSELGLELTDIIIKGTAYALLTSTYDVKGAGEGSKTTRKVFGGAGLGALIGGIAGGGKGAAIGAAIGGVTGTAMAGSKKGESVVVPSETLIEFRLQQPVQLPAGS